MPFGKLAPNLSYKRTPPPSPILGNFLSPKPLGITAYSSVVETYIICGEGSRKKIDAKAGHEPEIGTLSGWRRANSGAELILILTVCGKEVNEDEQRRAPTLQPWHIFVIVIFSRIHVFNTFQTPSYTFFGHSHVVHVQGIF
ncbi:hypothetical protein C8R45DRAFT_929373 [Mycena sanguinolenta]|nr:hypothetical protein C8R45DRAFT_929373 [Mycena sanguinolenta]